jgi:hypothetical protein
VDSDELAVAAIMASTNKWMYKNTKIRLGLQSGDALLTPSDVLYDLLIDWNEQLQLVTLGDESWGSNTSRTATTTTAPIPPRRRLVPTPSKPQSTVKSNKKKRITVNSNNSDKT